MENQDVDSGLNPNRKDRFSWNEEGELEQQEGDKKMFDHHRMGPSPFKTRKLIKAMTKGADSERVVYESIRTNGPSSFTELMQETRLGQWQVADAIERLVQSGKVSKMTSQGRVIYVVGR